MDADTYKVDQLMRRYALKGVREWQESDKSGRPESTGQLLGGQITGSEYLATQAVGTRRLLGGTKDLIPVPALSVKNIEWVFFKPSQATEDSELMFDLVFWLPGRKHVGFRLEPAHGHKGGRHEYSHLQLSSRFGGRQMVPEVPLDWLPKSSPAFPIPGTCSLDRFLMLVVALHGFPACTRTVLRGVCEGTVQARWYVKRIQSLLGLE